MKLSVVIPTLNEADRIEDTIRGALDAPFEEPGGRAPSAGAGAGPAAVEVIVVDGGSADGTPQRAEAAGARVLAAARGRARQLQEGALASSGDAVVFLHADTLLPKGWAAALRDALADERTVGGAFQFRFDVRTPALRFVEWGARMRNRLFRAPYGDQAIFVRRATLAAVGGVPQQEILEDLDLVARLRRCGRVVVLPQPVVTSARRYVAGGPLRTMARHWRVAAGWLLGVDRARLARWARR